MGQVGLIADLDLDYESFDSTKAAYLDPLRTLTFVEPVFAEISRVLAGIGIHLTSLVGGRGFRLVWKIPRRSEACQRLVRIGQVRSSLMTANVNVGLSDRLGLHLPHLFADRVRDLLWILGALDTTGVGICLDTGHAQLGEEVSKVVHIYCLWMMHVADNHGQYDDPLPPEGTADQPVPRPPDL